MTDGMISSTTALTPIESTTTFTVTLSGFDEDANTSQMRLNISPVEGLSFEVEDSFSGGTKTFVVTVLYDGLIAFPDGLVQIGYKLENVPDNYVYSGETQTTSINIIDGQARNRSIPVNQDNIAAFNRFANTTNGLKKHYKLTQNVTLTGQNNWTAIGTSSDSFTGSFDGADFYISGLNINTESDYQGLFGFIGAGATIENIGLINVSVSGNAWVGGVVGFSAGTVQNCYVTGDVNGSIFVGGVVGHSNGTVQRCYVAGNNVIGAFVGGVVGVSVGTVQNCYATGNVMGSSTVGGVVGSNGGTVQNCYASMAAMSAVNHVGGVVGDNRGTVQGCVALHAKLILHVGRTNLGRVVGKNDGGSLSNNYARDMTRVCNLAGFPPLCGELTSKDGSTTSSYNTQDFWRGTMGWSFDTVWEWRTGYLPILKGVGGTQNPRIQ
jgi:hypothetical protein